MRTLLAIITGCVGMLFTFALPWSWFGGTPSGYPDMFSWLLTSLGYAAVYQLPLSLVCALAIVWPMERMARRYSRTLRFGSRAIAWSLVATATYVVRSALARHELVALAIVSGILATGVATLLFSRIVNTSRTMPKPT